MERKEGYYWVRYTDWSGEPKHHWYAAHWDGRRWASHAFPRQENTDDYWDEINETRIPAPDENTINGNSTIEEIEKYRDANLDLYDAFFKLYRHEE